MSKKAYIFLADGFEDIEGLTVVDLMRRAGITITTVSIKNTKQITTAHGITMLTDTTFREADFSDADMLVLPGGQPGTTYLGGFEPLTDLVKSRADCRIRSIQVGNILKNLDFQGITGKIPKKITGKTIKNTGVFNWVVLYFYNDCNNRGKPCAFITAERMQRDIY